MLFLLKRRGGDCGTVILDVETAKVVGYVFCAVKCCEERVRFYDRLTLSS